MILAIATQVLQSALNQYLRLDPETYEAMIAHRDKVVALELQQTPITLYLYIDCDTVNVMPEKPELIDTTISGKPLALLQMSQSKNKTKGLFGGEISISGDLELGESLAEILSQMDIDWEEHLSRIVGDVAAHTICSRIGDVFKFGKQTSKTMKQNVSEYLQEEAHCLPTAIEVENFYQQVGDLQMSTDRLEARLQRLQRRDSEN